MSSGPKQLSIKGAVAEKDFEKFDKSKQRCYRSPHKICARQFSE
jgi:hypothetical protein